MPHSPRFFQALVLLCVLFLFSCTIHNHCHNERGTNCPSTTNATTAAQLDVDYLLGIPLDIYDLPAMSRRISAFSALFRATSSPCPSSPALLLYLFEKQFPWLDPSHLQCTPWSSKEHQRRTTTGIVISVGSADVAYAARLIHNLKNVLKSSLPIEVTYAGESDLSYEDRNALRALGPDIEFVNLLQYFDDAVVGLSDGGFATKPFAMLASRFEKVILIDAHAVFLQAPDHLFEKDAGLTDTGTLFWHDRAYTHPGKFSRRDWVESILQGQNPSTTLRDSPFWKHDLWEQMDSGVVCLDKSRSEVFTNLLFTTWMNTKEVREGVIYGHLYGDKETWWVAPELTSTPYYFSPLPASIIGIAGKRLDSNTGTFTNNVCGTHLLHFDSHKRPFWLSGRLAGRSFPAGRDLEDLTHWINPDMTSLENLKWFDQGTGSWCVDVSAATVQGTVLGQLLEPIQKGVGEVYAEERAESSLGLNIQPQRVI